MATQEKAEPAASKVCGEFNAKHEIGTLVEYWKGDRSGESDGFATTRTMAWPLCGEASILLTDVLGPVPLDKIKVVGDR